jgi:hypothetical protein
VKAVLTAKLTFRPRPGDGLLEGVAVSVALNGTLDSPSATDDARFLLESFFELYKSRNYELFEREETLSWES